MTVLEKGKSGPPSAHFQTKYLIGIYLDQFTNKITFSVTKLVLLYVLCTSTMFNEDRFTDPQIPGLTGHSMLVKY